MGRVVAGEPVMLPDPVPCEAVVGGAWRDTQIGAEPHDYDLLAPGPLFREAREYCYAHGFARKRRRAFWQFLFPRPEDALPWKWQRYVSPGGVQYDLFNLALSEYQAATDFTLHRCDATALRDLSHRALEVNNLRHPLGQLIGRVKQLRRRGFSLTHASGLRLVEMYRNGPQRRLDAGAFWTSCDYGLSEHRWRRATIAGVAKLLTRDMCLEVLSKYGADDAIGRAVEKRLKQVSR